MMVGVALYSFLPARRHSDRYDCGAGTYDCDAGTYDCDAGTYDCDAGRYGMQALCWEDGSRFSFQQQLSCQAWLSSTTL
jgi:hypothetical protein